MIIDDEKAALFKQVRVKLGFPIRKVEITDEMLCELLDMAIGDYAEKVQNFVIESNWASLYGKDVTNTDIAYALSVRTLDISKDYSYWFSKQVGLQNSGPWILKKDFFKIEKGKQVYVVPAGREINKVLWITPPETDAALFASYAGFGTPFGEGVYGQMGFSSAAAFGGAGSPYALGLGTYAFNLYDVALLSASMAQKNKFFRCDLTYKVTAGPNGTHLIHLMSTPGSKLTFGGSGINMYNLNNCVCWYTYYDVNPSNADECRKANPDVLLTPDQVPLDKMDYALFNSPTKVIIRQLLIAHAAETLGLIRGKFNGQINMISSPLSLDFQSLLSMGQREKDNVMQNLDNRLQRMSPYETMKRQAEMVQSMLEMKKGSPLGIYVI